MKKLLKVRVHCCEFVFASDLFKNHKTLWREFCESSPPFSWGDNNRSLVTIDSILNHLAYVGIAHSDRFINRCNQIGLQMYVDLEN